MSILDTLHIKDEAYEAKGKEQQAKII